MNPLSRKAKVVCLIGLISLLVVIGLLAYWPSSVTDERGDDSVGNMDVTPGRSNPFSGTWVADPVKRGENTTMTLKICFLDKDRCVTNSTSVLKGQEGKVYPGPTKLFRYSKASEGNLVVTLLSSTFDGEEMSKDKDKMPKEWHYRLKEDGALCIEVPTVAGPANYTFRRDQ